MSGPGSRTGAVISGKWRVDHLLGRGGMGEVYAATHRNGKRAALKILHAELAGKPATLRRFRREGYAANRVGHPAVVTVDDDDVCEDGAPYLVMELLQGQTLEELRVAGGGKLPVEAVVRWAAELMEVMAVAHRRGVVHRDIKPSNLLVTNRGTLKVLDFGIARVLDAEDSEDNTAECFLGTPSYMAPEQARGRWDLVDARSDIYSIGATLFTLLSGRAVHEAATRNEQLGLAMTAQAPSLSRVAPEVPELLANVIDGALRYDPEKRWASVDALRRGWLRAAGEPDAEESVCDSVGEASWLQREVTAHAVPTVITEHSVSLPQPRVAARRASWLGWATACAMPVLGLAVYASAGNTAVPASAVLKPAVAPLRSDLDAAVRGARSLQVPRSAAVVAPVVVSTPPQKRVRASHRAVGSLPRITRTRVSSESGARARDDARSAADELATQLDRRR